MTALLSGLRSREGGTGLLTEDSPAYDRRARFALWLGSLPTVRTFPSESWSSAIASSWGSPWRGGLPVVAGAGGCDIAYRRWRSCVRGRVSARGRRAGSRRARVDFLRFSGAYSSAVCSVCPRSIFTASSTSQSLSARCIAHCMRSP